MHQLSCKMSTILPRVILFPILAGKVYFKMATSKFGKFFICHVAWWHMHRRRERVYSISHWKTEYSRQRGGLLRPPGGTHTDVTYITDVGKEKRVSVTVPTMIGLIWNVWDPTLPTLFLELLQKNLGKVAITKKAPNMVAYPIHMVPRNCAAHCRRRLIGDWYTFLGFVPVSIADGEDSALIGPGEQSEVFVDFINKCCGLFNRCFWSAIFRIYDTDRYGSVQDNCSPVIISLHQNRTYKIAVDRRGSPIRIGHNRLRDSLRPLIKSLWNMICRALLSWTNIKMIPEANLVLMWTSRVKGCIRHLSWTSCQSTACGVCRGKNADFSSDVCQWKENSNDTVSAP